MKKLFTGDNCSNCEAAKKYIAENNITDIEIVHIDPSERSGRNLQMQYRVMGVPTLITFD
jgi:glutaredoxin-related protein